VFCTILFSKKTQYYPKIKEKVFRFMVVFCLFFNFFGQGMDISLYDPNPIFCIWALSQKPELNKDVRKAIIIRHYMKEKRQLAKQIYGSTLAKVKITMSDLILLQDNYLKGFDQLNYTCWYSWKYKSCFAELTKEDYETICSLPLCLRRRFNINREMPNSVMVAVEEIGKKEISFEV